MKDNSQEQEGVYILNPGYGIRQDKKRAIIFRRSVDPVQDKEITDILALMHPVYAIILSFFDGKSTLNKVIEELAGFLKIEKTNVYKLIFPLLENDDKLNFQYDGNYFHLPKKILIKRCDKKVVEKFDIRQFFIPKKDLDFKSWQLFSPLDILFVINTICVINCIYCYADRRNIMNCQIPFERFQELIQEAKKIGIRSFDLTGGEVFLYPGWEKFLEELVSNGFTPYISTKMPISSKVIEKLKNIGIKSIQISIDSIVKEPGVPGIFMH
jgi:nitrogen fixation protein